MWKKNRRMEEEQTTNMTKMAASMETLGTAIVNGFATIRQILQPQQTNNNRGWYPDPDLQIQNQFPQHQPAQHQPDQNQPTYDQPSQQHLKHQSPQNQHTQYKPSQLHAYNQSHYTNQSLNATNAGSYQSQITIS